MSRSHSKKRRTLPLVAISWFLGLCILTTSIFTFVIMISIDNVEDQMNSSFTTNIAKWTYRAYYYTPEQVQLSNVSSSNVTMIQKTKGQSEGGNEKYEKEEKKSRHDRQQFQRQQQYQPQSSKFQHSLPQWIAQYFKWHHDMRLLYPGNKIFTDPDAPKILIRICHSHQCGGLHDRLGQLPLDLFLAARSNRILFIQWFKPYSLEEFLVPPTFSTPSLQTHQNGTKMVVDYPNRIDWRMPKEWTQCRHLRDCIGRFLNIPSLETNVGNGHVRRKNYSQMMDANYYNLTRGALKDEKIVQFEIMGHGNEDWLEDQLKREGETDMIHHTPTFGNIFHSFFQLSPPIQIMYNQVTQSLNLSAQEYIAVHLRVRHPSGYKRNAKMDGQYAGNADRNVPPFANQFRESAIKAAIRALECTQLLKGAAARMSSKVSLDAAEFLPVYMMSDTKDLVKYFAFDLSSQKLNDNRNHNETQSFSKNDPESIDSMAKHVASKFHIVSRLLDDENLHIDKATPPGKLEQYYSVFLDLFIGINAKCIVFGIGNYAVFAAKISFTPCKIRYQKAKLGTQGIEDSSLSRDQICGKVKKSW